MEKQEILPENVQQAHKVTTVITEETFERKHSIRSIQAMGNVFKTEDEEEVFDNVYLGIFCISQTLTKKFNFVFQCPFFIKINCSFYFSRYEKRQLCHGCQTFVHFTNEKFSLQASSEIILSGRNAIPSFNFD